MNQRYPDLIKKLGKPLWWDECGVPRYAPFRPDLCNNIYAEEAVLLRICCQGCGAEFKVAMTRDRMDHILHPGNARSLSERIRDKSIHYGDPPAYGCCAAGPTMNCEDLAVLQFWKRQDQEFVKDGIVTDVARYFEWKRIKELEIKLMDKPEYLSDGQEKVP